MTHLLRRAARALGPGFLTGAADNDPAAVGTYSQSGALFGYGQLWTALYTLPFMTAIQEMCGRIGMVTGKGLAGVIREHYSRGILYGAVGLLLVANIVTIGADLGAMAASVQLLLPVPFLWLLLGITVGPMLLEILIPYPTYARFLKFLTLFLFAYLATAVIVTKDWAGVFGALVIPHLDFSPQYVLACAAILGTTISPYLFFWQSDEEVEEEIVKHRLKASGGAPKVTEGDLKDLRMSTAIGMLFSQAVTVFIVVTAASTLGVNGITQVDSAAQAASALRPFAGDFAALLFTLGIVGVGLLAVPVLAGSGAYAISEIFGWKASLGKSFRQAPGFYMVIILSTLAGLIVNASPISPIRMLFYSSVLNGVIAPILMVLILLIANNPRIMGERTNSRLSNILGWTITAIMGGIALLLFWQLLA